MSLRGATPRKPEPALLVFARAPVSGRVKTRLAPLLGKQGTVRLYKRMAEKALKTVCAVGAAELCCAPTIRHAFFVEQKERFDLTLKAQGRGDLGERMYRALRRHRSAILIGSDCPALRPSDLRAAARALRDGADAVFSPAEDGGYALIGVRRHSRRLFDGIDWGSSSVMAQTRRRLEELGWTWRELRTVWDVDRPGDVARLRKERLL